MADQKHDDKSSDSVDISALRVGVVGAGQMGQALSRLLRGMVLTS